MNEGVEWLIAAEPRFAGVLASSGPPEIARRKEGFAALLDAIISQQVSVAAADAIWNRLKAAGRTGPRKILWASDEDLRACGLSRQKVHYVRALAHARIDYPRLSELSTEEVVRTLTEVPGVGRWTAEIYAIFSLCRADVFAPGDLALQEAARLLFDMKDRPTPKTLDTMALAWSPWRGVAARLLWDYYRTMRKRRGIR